MYLMRLVNMPVENRIDEFIKILQFHKVFLKNEKKLEEFILIYPEWVLGFGYVKDLKEAIAEGKF